MSPQMYGDYVQPFHQKLVDRASRYDKPTMMHCCGSVCPSMERLIDMGLRILNPIQPSAKNMHPEKLADAFGGRIAFHGGIDIQAFLPNATPQEVREKADYTSEILGKQGGYIMAGSHHIQADTPLDNVLAMYGL